MTTLITAAELLTEEGSITKPAIVIEDGVIRSIATRDSAPLPAFLAATAAHHDYPGGALAPAFLDVHVHGCRGRDVMEATANALNEVSGFLARHGVGAYLPTTVSAPNDATLRALNGLATLLARAPEPGCARPLGIHLEGPFLSHAKRGAHAAKDLQAPSLDFFNAMWEAAEGRVSLITIAPELPWAVALIEAAVARGVRVSIGHSDSLREDAESAIRAGAASATHTFNAMRGLTQREPGMLGTVLTTDALYAELICDGLHVDPAMVRLFARAKPRDRAILITDAMSATGMPDGSYRLGELDVQVTGGRAIIGEDTLAGSTLTLDRAVENYMRFTGGSLADAVRAVTANPARMTGLERTIGTLAAGTPADLNVLSPSGELRATYLGGVRV